MTGDGGDDGLQEETAIAEDPPSPHEELDEQELDDREWELARDGSISRRPAWRRPNTKWIYPFAVGATLALGMGSAPRSEIYINLACLAHPPQQGSNHDTVLTGFAVDRPWGIGGLDDLGGQGRLNTTIPEQPESTAPKEGEPLSAADEWFLKLQHDIYEYNLHHQADVPQDEPRSPAPEPEAPSEPEPTPGPGTPEGDGDGEAEPTKPNSPNPPWQAIDPRLCKKDPGVQAAAARLTMVMTLAVGLLTILTTGYWGQKSDKIGRTKIMAISETGFLLSEICFILVATFPYLAPGGYRSLIIGPTLDGLLGGFSTMHATVHAFVADVTPDGSRASTFGRLQGVTMAGFAVGPVLGSFLIQMSGNIMLPFYINVCVHAVYIPAMLFILPESLSSQARAILKKNHKLAREAAKRREVAEREWESEAPESEPLLSGQPRAYGSTLANQHHSIRRKRTMGNLRRGTKRAFKFLQPLAIFAPRERDDGTKDWSITFMGCASFLLANMSGIMQTKTQFVFYAYGWTSAQLGPYMSFMSALRSSMLLIVLPIIMYYAKPYFTPPTTVENSDSSTSPPNPPPPKRSAALDLVIMRVSLLVENIPYVLLFLNPSAPVFVLLSTLITLGSCSGPAANSLALSLLGDIRESGRLFGAIGVLHALGGTIISPLVFGTLFAYTVGIYAPTVFGCAAIITFVAQIFLAMVKVNRPEEGSARGRSRSVKRVNSVNGRE